MSCSLCLLGTFQWPPPQPLCPGVHSVWIGLHAAQDLLTDCVFVLAAPSSQLQCFCCAAASWKHKERPGSQENSPAAAGRAANCTEQRGRKGCKGGGIFRELLRPQPAPDVTGHRAHWTLAGSKLSIHFQNRFGFAGKHLASAAHALPATHKAYCLCS